MDIETIIQPSGVVNDPREMAESTLAGANSGSEFWRHYLDSFIPQMLQCTGSYTVPESDAIMKFLRDHAASLLGPHPAEPHAAYTMTTVGSPFEVSLNLTSSGKAKVRCSFEIPYGWAKQGTDPFGEAFSREMLPGVLRALGANADSQWMDSLLAALCLSPQDADALQSQVSFPCPSTLVGFDFDGSEISMKFYMPAMRRAVVQGRSSTEIILESLYGLSPMGKDLSPSLDLVKSYISQAAHGQSLIFVGVDCIDPVKHRQARVKVYMQSPNNSWAAVRDVMTLGGRVDDAASLKRVELLKSVWHLFRNEPEGAHDDDENWSKPYRLQGTHLSGLQFSVEIKPGNEPPETKIYIPVFQFVEDTKAAERNVESVLNRLGHNWGQGKYSSCMEQTFGRGKEYGHHFTSFSYSEKKGVYITSYVSKPIVVKGSEFKNGTFEYK